LLQILINADHCFNVSGNVSVQCSGVRPAAGLKNGQCNRKRIFGLVLKINDFI